jgi:hypothetical protein
MVDYSAALKRPFMDLKKLFLGGLLILLWFAVMVAVSLPLSLLGSSLGSLAGNMISNAIIGLLSGVLLLYFILVGLQPIKRKSPMPQWPGIAHLLSAGFRLGLVLLVYMVVLSSLSFAASHAILGSQFFELSEELNAASLEVRQSEAFQERQSEMLHLVLGKLIAIVPVMLILSFLGYIITSAAEFRFVDKGSFSDAFNVPLIFTIAFSVPFLKAASISFLIFIASIFLFGVLGVLLTITLVGIVLVPYAFTLYMYIITTILATILGQAYREVKPR